MAQRIIIIGAGPTGIGAAVRLLELEHPDWIIYEANAYPGGLSASIRDHKGFTWDHGGHVLFSNSKWINRLMDDLGHDFFFHYERKAFVRVSGKCVPFPFQRHLENLPGKVLREILEEDGRRRSPEEPPQNFKQWLEKTFGSGQCRLFFYPYNQKIWGIPLSEMSYSWVNQRISPPGQRAGDRAWGPNSTFRYPRKGGMGAVFEKLAAKVADHIKYNSRLVSIDTSSREVTFDNGQTDHFDCLISSMPLHELVGTTLSNVPDMIRGYAAKLRWNSCAVSGAGFIAPTTDSVSWTYFPEQTFPFYRVTALSSYAASLVPESDVSRFASFMCETTVRDETDIPEETAIVKGILDSGMTGAETFHDAVSFHRIYLPHAYPIPTLERDRVLFHVQSFLESLNIYSRGRFGGWKYEVGNMDHSMLQGMEAVDRIVLGREEKTYQVP